MELGINYVLLANHLVSLITSSTTDPCVIKHVSDPFVMILLYKTGVRVMVFNATLNNISVISWLSFIGGVNWSIWRKTTDLPQVIGKLYHIMLYQVTLPWAGFELTTLMVICTDWTGSSKSNMILKVTKFETRVNYTHFMFYMFLIVPCMF